MLHHLISSLFTGRTSARKGRLTRRTNQSFRPNCERLEDRCVPANLSINPAHVYNLNGTLADQMGGPSLVSEPGGTLLSNPGRYTFNATQGLRVTGAVANPGTYSVVMRFEIDSVITPAFKKILDFANRTSDAGLYVAGSRLQLYPAGPGITNVVPNTDFVLTLTRNGSLPIPETKVYFNNVLQATYTGNTAVISSAGVLWFFKDDGGGTGESVGGSVDYIATFNGVLTPADVAILGTSFLGVTASSNSTIAPEGQTGVMTGTWSDNGVEDVTLSASYGTVVKNANGTWSWSGAALDGPGSQQVIITATDTEGGTTSTNFTLHATNVAPSVAANSASVTVNEGSPASMLGTWSDPGVDVVSLSASVGTVVQNADGTWSWSGATVNGPTSQLVTIIATDSDGATSSTEFTVIVDNVAPDVGAASGSTTADEGQQASLSGTWSDAGGDAVTLSASVGNVVQNADHTWVWTGVFTANQTVTITATDADGASNSTSFTLTVNNLAPTTGASDLSVTVAEGGTASLSGTWSDPGADEVTLSASVGTVVKDADGTWSWNFSTADGPDDSQTVTITATDSEGASSSATFELIVTNVAPTVAVDADSVSVVEGEVVYLSGSWGDPGADVVTLASSVGIVVKDADGTWSWSYATADGPDDSQTVTITATDSDGATSSTSFGLTVTNAAPAVAADASSVTVAEGGTASLSGTWSDPGADEVTLSASVGSITQNVDGTWSWSYSTADGPANSQTVTITATDSDGAFTSTSFGLTVDNVAPSVAADASSVSVAEGGTVSTSGTWSDPGADEVTLSASVGSILQNADGTWSWSYSTADGPDDSQTVTITATDSDGATSSTSFGLTVDNVAPAVAAGAGSVAVAEGGSASMSGTWSDAGNDVVTLSASVGSILQNADGTWSWSYSTADGPANSQTVTITATDSDGDSSSTSFALNVTNVAPTVASSASSVTVPAGGTASMSGTWSDPGADVVTLSASVGTVVKNANGTWSWSHVASSSQTVTITATDSDGATSSTTFALTVTSNGTPQITRLVTDATLSNPSEDDSVALEGAFANAGKHVKVRVNWGDGSRAENLRVDQLGDTFRGRHDYDHGGIYTITVTLTDENGATVTQTTTAVVSGAGIVNGTLQVIGWRRAEDVRIERVVRGVGRFREEFYRVEVSYGEGRCRQTEVFTFRADQVREIVVVAATNDRVHLGKGVSANVVTVPAQNVPGHHGHHHHPHTVAELFRHLAGVLEALWHGKRC